ncbi:hypothetical protein BC833DRAFT_585987 [Globomyces pollinis-pini]|nr:hypothetical protein BC833DRAFT_585987 [Globomyces pollinis-pini]
MDKADSEFLQHLFRENNQLRGEITSLQRELHNLSTVLEDADEEIKTLKTQNQNRFKNVGIKATPYLEASVNENYKVKDEKGGNSKDAEEYKFTVERQEAEIFQMGEELYRIRADLIKETDKNVNMERELQTLQTEVKSLNEYKEQKEEEAKELMDRLAQQEPNMDEAEILEKLKDAEQLCILYRNQMLEFSNEANQIQNAQQNQLQGVESIIERIRDEYEEFIRITKIENESFQARQKAVYNALKEEFDKHKNQTFEEKKRTMMEYQNILTSMQALFDEYRTTTEFLFKVEIVKLEEEISSQASRYEQEIMYVIQAKDKFYLDMMVTKDAKIMGLIEGSDLQSIMQKHELDMENLRKEHSKDIERVKSDHESESKNVMLLLQRQNVSLESKTEKLQSHLKNIEGRMKELMNTVDLKNKTIAERDQLRAQVENDYQKKLGQAEEKITKLGLEKERLRHKVIRLNLNAKGEGENSIENMLKRLNNDTSVMKVDFEELGSKYNTILNENLDLTKKMKEKEKSVEFLEKELKRRSAEFNDMTNTFEEFLAGRARQARRERNQKLLKMATLEAESKKNDKTESKKIPEITGNRKIVKTIIPERGRPIEDINKGTSALLERGHIYLRRFKNLSKAFSTGDYRAVSNIDSGNENQPGPWQKFPLYQKLEETSLAIARLYGEQPAPPGLAVTTHPKPLLYSNTNQTTMPGVKVYNEKIKPIVNQEINTATINPKSNDNQPNGSSLHNLRIGGTQL